MAEARVLGTFERMDYNQTGLVTRAQLKEVLLSLGGSVWDEKVVEELLTAFSADRDEDALSYAEFLNWIGEGGTFNQAAAMDARQICGEIGAELDGKDDKIASLQRQLELAKAQVDRLSEAESAQTLAGPNPSPLHTAALNGDAATVQMLATAVALRATNAKGITALHLAAFQGHSETLQALLTAGANKESRCQQGRTPIHLAALKGHLETTKILLDAGAKATATTSSGATPKDLATDADVIALLSAPEASA